MKIKIQKRYCLQKSYGGPESVLLKLKELREKHPEHTYVIEFNERAYSRPYSITRVTEVELEVPDAPSEDEFPQPRNPRPKKIKAADIEQRTEEKKSEAKDHWNRVRENVEYTLYAKHLPTGTEVSKRSWYPSPQPWERQNLIKSLEAQLDPKYAAKKEAYDEAMKARMEAEREWSAEVAAIMAEAKKEEALTV